MTANRWAALGAMCCAPVLVVLDASAVNIALPSIQRSLHAELSHLQWIVIAYQVAFAVLLITGGRLGDIFGRRRLFVIGAGLFGLASLAGALAPSVGALIASRALQGAGGACMIPASLAMITQLFEPHERSLAIGIWSGISGLALAAGPLIGGTLVEHAGWQAVLLVNPAVALLAIALALRTAPPALPAHDPTADRRIDYLGIVLLTLGAGTLMLALVAFAGRHPKPAPIAMLLAISAGALTMFVRTQRRSPTPLLRLALFRNPTFATGNVVMFATYTAVVAQFFYIALFLQNVAHLSPLDTGLRLLPVTVSVALTAPLAGRLMNRVGPRPLVTSGLLMTAGAMALLRAELVADAGGLATGCAFALLGGGMGLVFASVNAAALRAVDRNHAGAAAGTLAMARHLGITFGIGLIAAAAGASARVDLAGTVDRGLILGLAVVLATTAVAWRGLRADMPAPLAAAAPAERAA